jgi:hypothetical protein
MKNKNISNSSSQSAPAAVKEPENDSKPVVSATAITLLALTQFIFQALDFRGVLPFTGTIWWLKSMLNEPEADLPKETRLHFEILIRVLSQCERRKAVNEAAESTA